MDVQNQSCGYACGCSRLILRCRKNDVFRMGDAEYRTHLSGNSLDSKGLVN